MATDEQIEALIQFILQQGDALLGLDGLVATTEQGIADALVELPRPEAVEAARRRAAQLRDLLTNAEAQRVAEIIVDTLENGKSLDSAKRRIREHVGLTPGDEKALENLRGKLEKQGRSADEIARELAAKRQEKIDERAARIAHNEVGNALEEGNYQRARSAGATHKINVDAGDARVSKICRACTAQGVIPIDEAFASGAQHPPHHSGCRCSASTLTNPSGSRVDRLNKRNQERLRRIEAAEAAGGIPA